MKVTAAIAFQALFTAATFAAPHSRSSDAGRRTRLAVPLSKTEHYGNGDVTNTEFHDNNWAGAIQTSAPSGTTWTSVTGTFVVPIPSAPNGQAAYSTAWVGIDGWDTLTSILQTGVDFNVDSSGAVTYQAWCEWFPENMDNIDGISFAAGDSVQLSVVANSSTTGTCYISNLTNGQSVQQDAIAPNSSSALLGVTAEWIVEDYAIGGSLTPFADFDSVQFTSCSATDSSGAISDLTGASTVDIQQNGQNLTASSLVSNSEVDITYQ